MDSHLTQFLISKDFDAARELLQRTLLAGELIDPRDDHLWAPIADNISVTMTKNYGLDATIPFWETLLIFFIEQIEPIWGHAHKGHIYFRLGLHVGRHDLAKACSYLTKAREEDSILHRQKGGTEQEIMARTQQSSSHVALTILEGIEDADFSSAAEKKQFSDNLFGPSFDAAIFGQTVRPDLVMKALDRIAPHQTKPVSISLYNELSTAADKGMPFTTASLTGTVLESILLGVLLYQKGISILPNGKPIGAVELGRLLKEAISHGVFPSNAVQATMQLVHIFRNRLHPGNEFRQDHKLTFRVSITLKTMFELALIEWSQSIL